ncbi:MAG: DUF1295 domain-containing protein [Dokdonella sp.]
MIDILIVLIAAAIAMFCGWLLQRNTHNAGIVDVLWAVCMGASALLYAAVSHGALIPRLLVAIMGSFWGFRLGMHLLHRVLNESEDGRYRYLREHWNGSQAKFLAFFMGQALLTVVFSLPFYVAASNPANSVTIWTMLAVAVWATSLIGESVADVQLARFRSDHRNRGRTCRDGLWRYSRHPNYFFEWMHWFSYVFLAVGVAWPLWALSWLGPALMLVSLYWITGIPFTEAQALRSRGSDYRDYQRTTSPLIPWFPGNSEGKS